jgi:hypothetical protein
VKASGFFSLLIPAQLWKIRARGTPRTFLQPGRLFFSRSFSDFRFFYFHLPKIFLKVFS